jgi:RES domain-containing protein
MPVPIRDRTLLDALDRLEKTSFSSTVWRSVREGRSPRGCWRAGGRWDDRTFDVLYTSVERRGAIEERRFHLFRGQPFPPSRVRYELFELRVKLSAVISFTDLAALQSIGMDTRNYGAVSYDNKKIEYPKSQQIAEACFFLGADGILVPSARYDCANLIIFCEQDTYREIELVRSLGQIAWSDT